MKKLCLIFFALCAIAAFGAEKRALVLDDLYRLKSLGDLALSPDGKTAAFTVTTYDFHKGKRTQAIWLVDADGGNLRQITAGESYGLQSLLLSRWKDAWIHLRPLRFRSDLSSAHGQRRSEETDRCQHRQFRVRCGRLTASSSSFTSTVYPECGADDACNKEIADTWDKGPA